MKVNYRRFIATVFFILGALVNANAFANDKILYYADSFVGDSTPFITAFGTLTSGSFTLETATSWTDFNNKLNAENYSLVVALNQNSGFDANLALVQDHIDNGGSAIIADWTRNPGFATAFEASYTNNNNQSPISIVDPDLADNVNSPIALSNPGWGTYAMGMQPIGNGTTLATFPNSDAAIILGNDGRTIILGFLADTLPLADAQTFFENTFTKAAGNAITALAFDNPNLDATSAANASVSGMVDTNEVAPGTAVNVTFSDQQGQQILTTVIVELDGSFSASANVTDFIDGQISAQAQTTRLDGVTISRTASADLDIIPSNITVTMPHIHSANNMQVPITGTTVDVPAGNQVVITVTDSAAGIATVSPIVNADGTYSATLNLFALTTGAVTVQAQTTDNNGNIVMDTINRLRLPDAQLDVIACYFQGDFECAQSNGPNNSQPENNTKSESVLGSTSLLVLLSGLLLVMRRRSTN